MAAPGRLSQAAGQDRSHLQPRGTPAPECWPGLQMLLTSITGAINISKARSISSEADSRDQTDESHPAATFASALPQNELKGPPWIPQWCQPTLLTPTKSKAKPQAGAERGAKPSLKSQECLGAVLGWLLEDLDMQLLFCCLTRGVSTGGQRLQRLPAGPNNALQGQGAPGDVPAPGTYPKETSGADSLNA